MASIDIAVESAEGLPAHSYISVRLGETRRQVPLKAGEVLSFPSAAGVERLPKAYTVDVFKKIGSKHVSLAGISALGGSLRQENLAIPSLDIEDPPVTVSLAASLSEDKPPTTPGDKRREVAAKARQYLEKYDVQSLLHDMFTQMLERLPGDPLAFMVDFLEQKRDEALEREPRSFAGEPGLGDAALPGFAEGGELPGLSNHHSLMAAVLRREPDLYASLCETRTKLGVSLAQCIKPGVDCPGHELVQVAGAFAGDAESYELFSGLFEPIVAELHSGWRRQHFVDDNPTKLSNAPIDDTGRCAVFATVEARRNLAGLRMPSACSRAERREVERVLGMALGELRGSYLPLRGSQSWAGKPGGMSAYQEERLRNVGMLFAEPDSRMRLSAGFGRHWPDARGVLVGEAQGLCLWCNEEDHLRFFAKQEGANLKQLWAQLEKALRSVERSAKAQGYGFSRNRRLGYITSCPSRLGCALRIAVSLRLPLLAATVDLPALCRSLGLQAGQVEGSATHGGSLWNVMSGDGLGISEVDLINSVITGCQLLVGLEQRLERGEAIYDSMPGLGSEPFPGFPTDRCPAKLPELTGNHSLAAAVLQDDPALYSRLRTRKTSKGVSLAACVKPGMDDGSPAPGLVAGDECSYATFGEIFDPVIRRLHGCTAEDPMHPTDVRLSKINEIEAGPAGLVAAVRVELRRNLSGLRLAPCCSRPERQEVERLLVKGMLGLGGAFKGDYLPLAGSVSYAPKPGGVSMSDQLRLCEQGLLFGEPTLPSRLSAGLGRDWPEARGAFVAEEQDLWIWCNEEDHLRVISQQEGRNLRSALARALDCVQQLEAELRREGLGYVRDGRLGYLTVDPAHLGSALRCTVTLRLPRLSSCKDFLELCQGLQLQAAWRAGAWDLANGPCLGLSEVEVANLVVEGCAQLVHLERQLEQGRDITAELESLGMHA